MEGYFICAIEMDVNVYVFYDSQHVTNAKFSLLFFPSLQYNF